MPNLSLALACDAGEILRAQGLAPDPWQRDLLRSGARYTLLCCTRGGGKSRATSALALHRALFRPRSTVLLVSRTQRQSLELFRYVRQGFAAVGRLVGVRKANETTLELENGSRIVALPGTEGTIRSYQGVQLLVIDEAARVPDELYRAVRPMLGVSRGSLIAISTPFGQKGWFWDAWSGDGDWHRVRVPWTQCPRLTGEFIAAERAACGDGWVRQEYECSFEAMSGLVYPDFAHRCVTTEVPDVAPCVGGIDFGFRNPFAAIWGHQDRDGTLWLTGERYAAQSSLEDHAVALPRGVTWEADPAGPEQIHGLRRLGHAARKASNAIQAGIAAVRARVESGRLKVVAGRCPNLLAEAARYHYPPDRPGENPVDADNHALSALRYLVARLDRGFVARHERREEPAAATRDEGWVSL